MDSLIQIRFPIDDYSENIFEKLIAQDVYWMQRCNEMEIKIPLFHCIFVARKYKSSFTKLLSKEGESLVTASDIEVEILHFCSNLSFKDGYQSIIPTNTLVGALLELRTHMN